MIATDSTPFPAGASASGSAPTGWLRHSRRLVARCKAYAVRRWHMRQLHDALLDADDRALRDIGLERLPSGGVRPL